MLLTNPEVCMIYLDIRTAPGQDGGAIRHDLRGLLNDLHLEGEVEQFVNRPGYEARGIEPLASALDEAHELELGSACEIAAPRMQHVARPQRLQRDGHPGSHLRPAGGRWHRRLRHPHGGLLRASRVYALTALSLCSARR